jgi:hypothetical protein
MTAHSNESPSPTGESIRDYEQQLVEKLRELQKRIRDAPLDLDIPRDTILGFLGAAGAFLSGPSCSKTHAEQLARAELTAALTPLGLYVGHRAYPLIADR